MQMFEKKLTNHGHTTKFSVTEGGEGWEVRVEEDSRLVRRAMYTDWHRVERAVSKMTLGSIRARTQRLARERRPLELGRLHPASCRDTQSISRSFSVPSGSGGLRLFHEAIAEAHDCLDLLACRP